MSKHAPQDLISAAVRDLDPATATDLTDDERARAEETFARIVATPVEAPTKAPAPAPRRRRRLLAAGGLAGAVGIAVPALLLGGGTAYGSWTPTPEPLSTAEAARAADSCRGSLAPTSAEQVVMAERRGEWTYVLLTGGGTEAICLLPNDLVGSRDPSGEGTFFGSSAPDAPPPPPVIPDGLDENTSMEGSTDEGWFVWTEGYVGSDVAGVTVHTSSGLDIEASVRGGRFAAWWPSVEPSSEHPSEFWTYTVHLADGTTQEVTG